jgi:hypothetical protein
MLSLSGPVALALWVLLPVAITIGMLCLPEYRKMRFPIPGRTGATPPSPPLWWERYSRWERLRWIGLNTVLTGVGVAAASYLHARTIDWEPAILMAVINLVFCLLLMLWAPQRADAASSAVSDDITCRGPS